MSDNGGARYGADEQTSFELQPPRPPRPEQPPAGVSPAVRQPSVGGEPPHQGDPHPGVPRPHQAVPHPGNPYAAPVQADPREQPHHPAQQAQQPAADPGTGRLIAGRYRLLARLGHGGMGTVWRAEDETVGREVAVKEPRVPDHLPERERANAFERMRREARAAARLDHPAVVDVHDVAVVDGRPWIVMELVRGRSLGDVLREGTLGAREAARIGLEVLGALEAAHAAGILHRDVKPDNVLLGRYDRVVLTDFGIAQIEGETNLTDTGGFVGSPEYIAPERVLGRRPGPAADLWSLGVVLYTATEGVSPFRRSNTPATLQAVLNATPAPPASAQGPLADAINGLLRKDPAHRPDAAQVRALLEAAANPPAPAPTQVVTVTRDAAPRGGVRIGRRTLAALGAVVVAAAVAAYLVVAEPFAGPLPDGWRTHQVKALGATLAVPETYIRTLPEETDDDHWVTYSDPSDAIWIRLDLDRKAEDTTGEIAGSAEAEMYDDEAGFEETGDYEVDMPKGPRTAPVDDATYRGRPAAENTITYVTDDTERPRPREMRIFYYRTKGGDMYKLTVSYPGKGDFTERGREVARTAIAQLEIDSL
ncbi:serine/threonine-protein kinase [Streptomyces glaucescens]|uniref:non-specific serine/threonine protein kinase n=1 Tax=Streptomyces glaucescens TaxID=1907 RepID=A0A089Z2K2_STRGA|nr:serine/threonine-protein kinase [Streptomyces glaucescens]AIS00061.1 serine/threonine protein kinase [Streptomyces glaucescens]